MAKMAPPSSRFSCLLATTPLTASTPYEVTLHGKPFTLEVYPASNPKAPKGTIFMGSGDVMDWPWCRAG